MKDDAVDRYENPFRRELRGFIPDTKPKFRTMKISDTGQVWIRIYADADDDNWLIFHENGNLMGTVYIPNTESVSQIRGNQIFSVLSDPDELPAVIIREVRFPA